MKRFILVLGLVAMVATLAVIPGAFGRSQADGINSRTITLGTTLPLSGPASLYARIGTGMKAYFSYINSRKSKVDGKRGVYGRQIQLNVYDDQYSEAQTTVQTRKAVEQDHVFAMLGGLGTENQLAVRDYLNKKKVPQLYVSTGLSDFGTSYKEHPWTIGWQPDYVQEGILHGQVREGEHPERQGRRPVPERRRTARSGSTGSRRRSATSAIVASQSYPRGGGAAAISTPVARLRASGADTLLVIATPTESITALVVAYRLGWKPNKLVNSVGATDAFMTSRRPPPARRTR